jgi:hypothetical protein
MDKSKVWCYVAEINITLVTIMSDVKKRGGKRRNVYPDQKTVRDLFYYSEENGWLAWRKRSGNRGAGSMAGNIVRDLVTGKPKYIMVKMGGVVYNQRDLIWIYFNGPMPEGGLKNIDGNTANVVLQNIAPRKPVVSFL